ncbi:hypothetical protein [Crossiella cryophila]|uniref:Secreted protein n=1 Tax=Crossiella cryophila TaxID=43355 RepID=A0A7W7CCH0_9PSEU|nr:hypothetical protein [Crossiella cryophila]MBB4678569.1 hypothetical protein [Crossiella cryophila]
MSKIKKALGVAAVAAALTLGLPAGAALAQESATDATAAAFFCKANQVGVTMSSGQRRCYGPFPVDASRGPLTVKCVHTGPKAAGYRIKGQSRDVHQGPNQTNCRGGFLVKLYVKHR